MEFTGKTAVVTGAASGIGKATCEAMIKLGIQAIGAVDRSQAINDVCDKINRETGKQVMWPYAGDVTNDAFRQTVIRELK
ncbi:MAG TPA: SDR family NAD(P)-dependent oxidoreductase, partial [Phycisphaerae bacterium]|nr:SDR family NAD(P)-dependent oxidoreductase [Phycisphaerae bacterium]